MRRQQICTDNISAIFESHLRWVLPPHKHLSSHKRAQYLQQQQHNNVADVLLPLVADDVAVAVAVAIAVASFVFFSARLNCQRRLNIHLHKLVKAFRAGKR